MEHFGITKSNENLGISIGNGSTGTAQLAQYTDRLIETIVLSESIELIYKRTSHLWNNNGFNESKVYKVIYSCVDGKWNKSEPIFGEIIPATNETYLF